MGEGEEVKEVGESRVGGWRRNGISMLGVDGGMRSDQRRKEQRNKGRVGR